MNRLLNPLSIAAISCLFLICSKNSRTPAVDAGPTSMLLIKAGTYLTENLCVKMADSSIESDFRQLIAQGAKVDSVDEDSNTALLLLARTTETRYFPKAAALAEILLENKADVNRKNDRELTALHLACLNGNRPLAELLLANGADIHALDGSACTPVVYAVTGGGHAEIVELLSEHHADLSWKDPVDSMSLLEIAEKRGYAETAEFLKAGMKSK